jgi:hypothetical protein
VAHILRERAGLSEETIISIGEPFFYYTSPGALNENVMACLVQVRDLSSFVADFPNYTSFKSAGTVRELDALQVLRASHVGGMFDARLEINIYHLLEKLGRSAGPWIGAPIALATQTAELSFGSTWRSFFPESVKAFTQVEEHIDPEFLSIREGAFVERTHGGDAISEVAFEYVIPKELSLTSVVALPVMKTQAGVFVGLDVRDLPAVQACSGSSSIVTTPAWRLPRTIKNLGELPAFLNTAMRREFSVSVLDTWELGGSYFCSPGVTPEVAYPFAVEIDASEVPSSTLHFVPLNDLRRNLDLIKDPHLLISTSRLIHSFGW